jgi:hypothetical protein
MPWGNGPLVLYHGTVSAYVADIRRGIDITKCRPRSEFGRGFYTTRVRSQAVEFANEKFLRMRALYRHNAVNPDPGTVAVIEFSVDRNFLGQLDTLAFVLPDSEWRDFVAHCRSGAGRHKGLGRYYEAVYGPVQIVSGEWWKYEQLSFHSSPAARALTGQIKDVHLGRPTL